MTKSPGEIIEDTIREHRDQTDFYQAFSIIEALRKAGFIIVPRDHYIKLVQGTYKDD